MSVYIADCDRVQGKALFASKEFQEGDVVHVLDGTIAPEPTRESIEIGPGQHITDPFGIYINHSSIPTTRIDGRNVVALSPLKGGDEINFDYNSSETSVVSRFVDSDTGVEVKGKVGE